ncbi:MAG: molybdopterin-dependent oxidoreductase [Dehalococcoidia bacterium]|nr:molybdopterin-dependent oxidoreductase [Dehalococcoidia bacterium]MDZ4247328.1 molybdopterin-dependent oxidoreductase [Dehalococcoidia bacterium]
MVKQIVNETKGKGGKTGKAIEKKKDDVWIPTCCWFCVMGPCLHRYHRVDGTVINVEGNTSEPGFDEWTRNQGRLCPKPFGLIEKVYNPYRVKSPLKRTNPEKGLDVDPGWVEISWDEALDTVAKRFKEIRAKDPRGVCSTFHSVAQMGMGGTWEAFYIAFGPMQDVRGGSGMRCGLGVHMFANTIHGAFRCSPDTNNTKYLLILGSNVVPSGGVCGNLNYAKAKKIVVDPMLSLTAAKADEWLPIKPGTDIALMLALIHIIIHELGTLDEEFLKNLTNSSYLVGADGHFIRDKSSGKPLVWDTAAGVAREFNAPDLGDLALEGIYTVDDQECKTAFQLLKEQMKQYTPEWATEICEIPAATIRRIAKEFVDNAQIGSTIRLDGIDLPYRPVDVIIGRPVEAGVHSYQNILAQHILVSLVGALESVGGHMGGCAHPTYYDHGIKPGADGMPQPIYHEFTWPPTCWSGCEAFVPFTKIFGHAAHLFWINMTNPPPGLPLPPPPQAYLRFRNNAIHSVGETEMVVSAMKKIPFIVSISYTYDEVTQLADIVLPDYTELERYDVLSPDYRLGSGRRFRGILLRQPIVEPPPNNRDISYIVTELADRIGFLDTYNNMINIRFNITDPYKLELNKKYEWVDIVDRMCKSLTKGEHDLEWFKEHGAIITPTTTEDQYNVHLHMVKEKIRYPVPYMDVVKTVGENLQANLAKVGVDWWSTKEYVALPSYLPSVLDTVPKEYDFYVTTSRLPQYSNASNNDCALHNEVMQQVPGQYEVLMNAGAARERGIKEGDEVWIESPIGRIKGAVGLSEGIRPDTLFMAGQFGQSVTPVAKDLAKLSVNAITPISYEWTDQVTGTMQSTIKVKVYKA